MMTLKMMLFSQFGGLLCCSHDEVRSLMEAQEEHATEEGINYVAMRNLFVREAKEKTVKVEKKTRTMHVRESAELLELGKTVNSFHSFADLSKKSNFSYRVYI